MNMSHVHTIRSSFLESCEYDKKTKILKITFRNGKEYEYKDVPQEVYNDFITAESAGKYYTANIKGQYEE
jgi:hypothetical protein